MSKMDTLIDSSPPFNGVDKEESSSDESNVETSTFSLFDENPTSEILENPPLFNETLDSEQVLNTTITDGSQSNSSSKIALPLSPQLQQIQKVMLRQKSVFTEQLNQLHKLTHIQKVLTGVDPLTGQALPPNDPAMKQAAQIKTKTTKSNPKNSIEHQLSSITNAAGGISTIENMSRFVAIAQANPVPERKLISVLLSTTDNLCFKRFVSSDGLKIIKGWLSHAIKDSNLVLVKLLLQGLQMLPVTLSALKSSAVGKVVKSLTSHADSEVKTRSNALVNNWMKLVSAEAEKKGAKSSSTATATATTAAAKKSEAAAKKSEAAAKKVAAKSADGATKPESKKRAGDESVGAPAKKVAISSSDDFDSMLSAPSVRAPAEKTKKHKMQLLSEVTVKKSTAAPSKSYTSKPLSADEVRKAKFKEKVLAEELQAKESKESITKDHQTATSEPPSKKLKVSTTPTPTPSTSATTARPTSPSSSPTLRGPQQQIPAVKESFAQPQKSEDIKQTVESKSAAPKEYSVWDIMPSISDEMFDAVEGIRGISKKTGKPKKVVSWAPAEKLEQVKLFENQLDVHISEADAVLNFTQARLKEHQKEREILANKKRQEEEEWLQKKESMEPTVQWREPPALELPADCVFNEAGAGSKQLQIQTEREMTVFAKIYLDENLPDSPDEPEVIEEDYDDAKVKIIPFVEVPEEAPPVQQIPPQQQQQPSLNITPELLHSLLQMQQRGVPLTMLLQQQLQPQLQQQQQPFAQQQPLQQFANVPSNFQQHQQGGYSSNMGVPMSVNVPPMFSGNQLNALNTFPFPQQQQNQPQVQQQLPPNLSNFMNTIVQQPNQMGMGSFAPKQQQQQQPPRQQKDYRDSRDLNFSNFSKSDSYRSDNRRDRIDDRANKVCPYYSQGKCKFGSKCNFKHEGLPPPTTTTSSFDNKLMNRKQRY